MYNETETERNKNLIYQSAICYFDFLTFCLKKRLISFLISLDL